MKTKKSEGYVESVSALALQYTISVYLHEWSYFYNALIVYLGLLLLSRNIASKFLCFAGFAVYFVVVCQSRIEFALNLLCYWLLSDIDISFSDRIILA
jgi:hypothetical protein